MRNSAIVIALLLASVGCTTVDPVARDTDVTQWLSVTPPMPGSEQWRCANFSHHVWEVQGNGESVTAHLRNFFVPWSLPFPRPELAATENGVAYPLRVTDGWIVGFNGGEFGRSLRWFSPDGRTSYKISDDQVIQFVDIADRHYAIEGLAHMGTNRGRLIQILRDTNTGRWAVIEVARLPEEPAVVLLEQEQSMLIVTFSGLVRVTSNGTVQQILKDTFWGCLYPSSATLDNSGALFIGMNQGVAKVTGLSATPQIRWLVPSQEYLESEWQSYQERK